ncbi:hypothetical protein GCM10022422_23210 [Flavobacterium ginsengisoli]|uniref:Ig-like domain-containing protein n=2 Tax=Flavobacterium ginsengisoli TaxID=871694 RepID=A0ABP7FG64_9FLAO
MTAQTYTETFDSLTPDLPSFTSNGKTFNLTSNFGFKVASQSGLGYNGTPGFIQVADPSGEVVLGQSGSITSASGTFKVNNLWLYVTGVAEVFPNASFNGLPGSITFRGKLAGSTVFTVVRTTTGENIGYNMPGNGFTEVNFATEGGSNNTNEVIDQLEIQLSNNYDYFAIDNFTFTSVVAPSIITNPSNKTICSGANTTFSANALNATSYQWQVNTGGGFGNISDNATYFGTSSATLSITGATSSMNGYQYRCVATGSGSVNSNAATLTVPTALSSIVSANTPSDYGLNTGSATVTVSGGVTPYFYSWSPSGGTSATTSGRAPGNYILTITDSTPNGLGGCSITQAVTILESPGASTNVSSLSGFTTCTGTASPFEGFIVNAAHLTSNLDLSSPAGYEISTTSGGPYFTNLSLTPSSGNINRTIYVRLAATATGTPAGNITISSTGITTKNVALSGTVNPAVSGQISLTNVSCNGGNNGAIDLTPIGGSGTYTYNWGGGITTQDRTLLQAGTYSVTITDSNGCSQTISNIVVGQPSAALGGSTVVTNIACNGGNTGAINLTPTGGTGPYTFLWNDGVTTTEDRTGLTAGTYAVTITDSNSCQVNISNITVGQSSLITANATVTHIACHGGNTGAINLTPSGGVGPYTYSWSDGPTTEDRTGLIEGTYTVTITDSNLCSRTLSSFTVSQPSSPLGGTAIPTNTTCFGGSNGTINLTPTGGQPPYTFNWVGGASTEDRTGLSAGTYAVTITDGNGCTATVSNIVVGQPTEVIATSAGQTNILCYGYATGTATVSATGGTGIGTYTYSWSPTGGNTATATGLTAGTYIATVTDANNCQATHSFTITEPLQALTATPSGQTNILCHGSTTGSATVTAAGGGGDYTYSWAPSGGTEATATGLAAGTYTVTVTDANDCQTTQEFILTEPAAALTTAEGTINNTSCYGGGNGTATVIASGGTGSGTYSYSWNTTPVQNTATATGLSAGTYTVTVTDANACTATRNFTISQPSILSITPSQTDVSCNGGSNGTATASVTGGVGTYTYSWSPIGGTGATATGLTAGTYTITVTDANNCQATQSYNIEQPFALTATQSQTDVLCNGSATGTATVIASGGTGSNYTYQWLPSGGTAATATGLMAGAYTCTIRDQNNCTITKSFNISEPTYALNATTSQVNATCSTGGEASVNVSGGVLPYSYLWSPSGATTQIAIGLAAGTHSVLVTDGNGCTLTRNFTIGTTNTLVATTSQVDVLCNGSSTGSASVTPSGAPGPFTYVWSPSVTNTETAVNLSAGNYSVTITSSNGCSIIKNFTITEPTAININPSQTNVSCHSGANGSASVIANGGTGAYTYAWAPSGGNGATATGLSAGTYTVTVTDANYCEKTQSFTITQPDALIPSISQTDVSCNGGSNGSATVNVTGGTGLYTYSWSPSGGTNATASGLSAGTYTVTVTDANLCEATATVTINEPPILSATIAKTDVLCNQANNGTATVIPTGGTGTYTYSWSPSGGTAATATGLSPNTYSVTVTDANGCFVTQSVIISEPSVLSASDSHTNVSCNGGNNGTASVVATGGTGNYSYLWAPSGGTAATATGLTAGTYTVTVTDENSCSTTNTITITEPDALTLTPNAVAVSCYNGSDGSATVSVAGGTGTYSYAWSPSGGNAATATGLTAGTYTVTVTDANSCSATAMVTINEPPALTATIAKTDVLCNQANNGTATVTPSGGTGTYTYSWSPSGGTAATATGLSPNTYSVTVTDANGCSVTESVIISEPSVLSASDSHTNVSCNGGNNGTASVVATGGTGNYSYLWAPSGGTAATATGLTAGTYTVTITDENSCSITNTITITEPDALTLTTNAASVSCHNGSDGSATVSVTGGTGTYSYAWSPSGGNTATATGLSAGTYTVTVTDENSCSATNIITITEPDALTLTANAVAVSCHNGNNGSATVSVTGGTGTYSYAWSPSGGNAATATDLAAGIYTVTATDANSCSVSITVEITQPANPVNLNTATITGITQTGASLSGTASSDGLDTDKGECLTEVGFVYAQHASPTIADTKISVTAALGTFTNSLSGLRGNRTYYVRTYAVNSNGFVNYGNEVSFTTEKYTLTINAEAGHTKVYGTADPVFNYTALGFANGDTNSILTGLLSRDAGENVGKYNIKLGSISAGADYIIEFTGAEFEITKANQTITWNQTLEFGCLDSDIVTLTATADSGLPISYTIANTALGTISGSTLNITGSGNSTITATQNGDQNHNGATAVVKPIEISQSGLVVQQWANVLFFDNKSNNFVAWQWYKNGTAVSGATRQYYSEVLPLNGTYYVIAKDKNGNSIKSCPIETTGTIFTKKIKIYPNPVKPGAQFTLECDFSDSQLSGSEVVIYDITGKLVQTISNVKAKNEITAPSQVALYIVVLKLADGQLKTINLLVK